MDDDITRETDRINKMKIKNYADNRSKVKNCLIKIGDSIIVKKPRKSKSDPYYDPIPYEVIKRKGNMIVTKRDNHTITRNSAFFKLVNDASERKVRDDDTDDDFESNGDEKNPLSEMENNGDGDDEGEAWSGKKVGAFLTAMWATNCWSTSFYWRSSPGSWGVSPGTYYVERSIDDMLLDEQ